MFPGPPDKEDWLLPKGPDAEKTPSADKPARPPHKDLDPIAEPHVDPAAGPDAPAAPKNPNVGIIPKPPARVSKLLASGASQ